MTVYALAPNFITNREVYDRFQATFMKVFAKFNGRLLAADAAPTVVEGEWDKEKIVLMSFLDGSAFSCVGGLQRDGSVG